MHQRQPKEPAKKRTRVSDTRNKKFVEKEKTRNKADVETSFEGLCAFWKKGCSVHKKLSLRTKKTGKGRQDRKGKRASEEKKKPEGKPENQKKRNQQPERRGVERKLKKNLSLEHVSLRGKNLLKKKEQQKGRTEGGGRRGGSNVGERVFRVQRGYRRQRFVKEHSSRGAPGTPNRSRQRTQRSERITSPEVPKTKRKGQREGNFGGFLKNQKPFVDQKKRGAT